MARRKGGAGQHKQAPCQYGVRLLAIIIRELWCIRARSMVLVQGGVQVTHLFVGAEWFVVAFA